MNKYALRQTPLAFAIGSLLAGGAVEAATITVTTNADGPPGSITDDCTLRAAVESANTDTAVDGCSAGGAGPDEIAFDAGLAHSTITLSEGQMEVDDDLTIAGPVPGDAAGMTIDGDQQSRIFYARGPNQSPGAFEVGLDSLTLTGGHTTEGGAAGGGGAVHVFYASLSLAHVAIAGNSTAGNSGFGGGLHVRRGDATLAYSTVSGNSTVGNGSRGGGVYVDRGDVTLTHSTVSGNWTEALFSGGGGLHSRGYGQEVTLTHSTISGNSTLHGSYSPGGGMSVTGGYVTLTYSTVSGNSTHGSTAYANGPSYGGGLYVNGGDITLTHSTVSGNSTEGDSAHGGGMYVRGDVTLTHATVAYNTAADGVDGVFQNASSTLNLYNSLIVQAGAGETGCNQTADSYTNALATDANCTGTATEAADLALGPLTDNGGPTQTHALNSGSVAADAAGDCQDEFGVDADQRGMDRPGFGSPVCDVGAFEVQFVPLLAPASLDFGVVRVGTAGAAQTVQLDNPFDEELELIAVAPIPGPDAAAFAVTGDNCTGVTLPAEGGCTVEVEFTPNDRRNFSVELKAMAAIGANSISLTGTGIAPVMGLAPQVFDFGGVVPGEVGGPLSLTVSNNGDDLLEVTSLSGLGAPFNLAPSGDCGAIPFTLAPDTECSLNFEFAPTAEGAAKRAVFVNSDSFGGNEAFVLQGEGSMTEGEIFEDRFEQ